MPNKKRILLAEDEEHLLEAIKLNLELEGYKVSTATNGKKALQIFKEERFNLVILDVMMPEIDGFEFLDVLRQDQAGRSIPVVVITAKTVTADDRHRLNGGVERVLLKRTLDADALLTEVRAVVGAR